MTDELKDFEKSIKKTHKVSFSPKYASEFNTQLSLNAFFAIANQSFEKLDWDVVYSDQNSIEARKKSKVFGFSQYTESINVSFHYGKIIVKSQSLGNEIWDNGRNSKRVHLFIHVFQNLTNNYSSNEIKELEKIQESKDNWDDYQIPTSLPKPYPLRQPSILFPIILGILTAIVLAFLVAKVYPTGFYIILLFEFLIGLSLAYGISWGLKLGNYTNFIGLRNILIASIIVFFIGSHLFSYFFLVSNFSDYNLSFFEFMKMKIENGLTIKDLNVGSVGLIISWIIQIGLSYVFGFINLYRFLINYLIKRVPTEVIDFAYYHFAQGKEESQVRSELSQMGWQNRQHQDEVFEALEGIQGNNELNKAS